MVKPNWVKRKTRLRTWRKGNREVMPSCTELSLLHPTYTVKGDWKSSQFLTSPFTTDLNTEDWYITMTIFLFRSRHCAMHLACIIYFWSSRWLSPVFLPFYTWGNWASDEAPCKGIELWCVFIPVWICLLGWKLTWDPRPMGKSQDLRDPKMKCFLGVKEGGKIFL